MAPHGGGRRGHVEALSGLKDALTRQFGTKARSLVETQVDLHLGGSKRQIGREDLDAIERGILDSMKQNRGGVPRKEKPLSRSVPSLKFTSGSSAPSLGGAASLPSPPPAPTLPSLPLGASNPGALARSASTSELTNTVKKKPLRPAPYGMSITGGTGFEHKDNPDSTRSGVRCQPKYPVPLPPKLKPMDHWDLLVAFDSAKYRQEERHKYEIGNNARKVEFRTVLDGQMIEAKEAQELEKKGLLEERELMLAQVELNKKYEEEEKAKVTKKKDEQNKMNTVMLEHIDMARKKNEEKKQRECNAVTQWLADEKAQREEEDRLQHIEYDRKCKQARKEMEEARKEREERRRQEQEHELYLMGVRNRILKEQEDAKAKALQDRKDRLAKIEASLGEQVASRDAEMERELERKIRQIQEEAHHKAMEDARKKQELHESKVKDMVATRERQIVEKHRDDNRDREEEKRLLELYRKEHEEQQRKDKAKMEKARQAREDLDKHLIDQMRRNAGVHPHHVMMTPRNKKTELSYNKALFEQMADEGFQADAVNTMMAQSKSLPDHHPEGKLIACPTIPRFKGQIHELELEAPDV